MKLVIPMILPLFPFALVAQETPAPAKPQPKVQATPETPPKSSPSKTSPRVVLPPKARTTSRHPTARAIPNVSSSSGSVRRTSPAHSRPAPPALQENITIHVKGSTQSGEEVDLAMTGIGPVFQSDLGIGKDDTILTHTYSVTPQGAHYLVEFSIGTRIKMVTSTANGISNYQYRDNTISGKVLLELGKPVTISNNQGKSLALTVLKP